MIYWGDNNLLIFSHSLILQSSSFIMVSVLLLSSVAISIHLMAWRTLLLGNLSRDGHVWSAESLNYNFFKYTINLIIKNCDVIQIINMLNMILKDSVYLSFAFES